MAKTEIDRAKLRVQLRRLRKDDLLDLLDRAIELMPKTRLPALVKGYVKPEAMRPDAAVKGGILNAVAKFQVLRCTPIGGGSPPSLHAHCHEEGGLLDSVGVRGEERK